MADKGFAFHARPLARFVALGAVVALGIGCWLRPKPYSPLPPFDPLPERLGQALEALEKRWPPVATYKGEGGLVMSGEGIRGKAAVQANILYASPDRLRFRASRLPLGTVFEIVQIDQDVAIVLNRERKVYRGTVGELASHPELIAGIEPLEVVRALLIGQAMLEMIDEERSEGRDPGNVPFVGDRLVFRRQRPASGGVGDARMEEYVVRRKDGLVEEARLYERSGEAWRLALTVLYQRWGEEGGRPYPRRLEIRAECPLTRLKIEVDKVLFNPKLSPEVFAIDARKAEVLPLNALFRQGS